MKWPLSCENATLLERPPGTATPTEHPAAQYEQHERYEQYEQYATRAVG